MTEFEILTALADTDGFTDRIAFLNRCKRKTINRTDRLIGSLYSRGLVLYDCGNDLRFKLSTAGYDRLAELEVLHAQNQFEFARWGVTTLLALAALLISIFR